MSEEKHTEGPWEFGGSDLAGIAGTVWAAGGDVPVADIYAHVLTAPEERRANGLLMAAAPDLLAALKPFANLTIYDDDRVVTYVITKNHMIAARAAIAKAEGRPK